LVLSHLLNARDLSSIWSTTLGIRGTPKTTGSTSLDYCIASPCDVGFGLACGSSTCFSFRDTYSTSDRYRLISYPNGTVAELKPLPAYCISFVLGFVPNADYSACENCPANTYQADVASTSCTACPEGTFSTRASTFKESCEPMTDSFGQCSNRGCIYTPASDGLNAGSASCPPGTWVMRLRVDHRDEHGIGGCDLACRKGTYYDIDMGRQDDPCIECPDGKTTMKSGARSIDLCVAPFICIPGWGRLDRTDHVCHLCGNCPADRYSPGESVIVVRATWDRSPTKIKPAACRVSLALGRRLQTILGCARLVFREQRAQEGTPNVSHALLTR
jgi:hypothetical protein